ncbi:MAG: ABC transporter permease [Candidatus Thermoplasmatota archaeon]
MTATARSIARIMGRRGVNALVTLFLVLILNFFLFRVMPGNPIRMLIPQDPSISQEYIDSQIEKFGLDQPMYVQFFTYLKNTFMLEFGDSFHYHEPVMDIIMDELTWTLILVGTSSVLMIAVGMFIGIIAAWKHGGLFDTGSLAFSLFFYAMPTFWFSMMLIVIFALELNWFPEGGQLPIGDQLTPFTFDTLSSLLYHLVLPAASLTIGSIAAFSIIMRGSLIDVMTEEYITTARAKGLTEAMVLKDHAVPNAMLPMVTLIAMDMAFVVGGAFQTEIVFNYKGIGWATVQATYQKDYPFLQAAFLIIAIAVIIANLLADLMLIYLDPRVKMG